MHSANKMQYLDTGLLKMFSLKLIEIQVLKLMPILMLVRMRILKLRLLKILILMKILVLLLKVLLILMLMKMISGLPSGGRRHPWLPPCRLLANVQMSLLTTLPHNTLPIANALLSKYTTYIHFTAP